MKKNIFVVTILFILVFSVIFIMYGMPQEQKDSAVFTQIISSDESRKIPVGFYEFISDVYNFSLLYPQGMTVTTFDEGEGAQTITFQNTAQGKGFQIFIVPYAEEQVTEDQFRKDLPSGIRENMRSGFVDGALAAFFYSKNNFLGDTYEIWFVHGGYLYEITTLKNDTEWLDIIINMWMFLKK